MIYRSENLGDYIVPQKSFSGVCVDIGSNVGSFLTTYGKHFKKIQFYEPLPRCFEICKKRAPYAEGFNEAVYSVKDKQINMVAHSNHDSGSSALSTDSINHDWTNEIIASVNTVDFDTVLKRAGGFIDYLKIDCETSEYYFFIDKNISNVLYIGMEIHWQMGKDKYDNLLEHIRKTHIIYGDKNFEEGKNKDLFCLNRSTNIFEQLFYALYFKLKKFFR